MLTQLALGLVLLVFGVAVHATVLDVAGVRVRQLLARTDRRPRAALRLGILIGASLAAFGSHVFQVWVWALVYLWAGEFSALENALYFSTVTFTTLGVGDVTASEQWRLLASFESAVGFFLFGISTAFVFEMMVLVWKQRRWDDH